MVKPSWVLLLCLGLLIHPLQGVQEKTKKSMDKLEEMCLHIKEHIVEYIVGAVLMVGLYCWADNRLKSAPSSEQLEHELSVKDLFPTNPENKD